MMITKSLVSAIRALSEDEQIVVYNGDCRDLLPSLAEESVKLTITSPPYFVGKSYDKSKLLSDFTTLHEQIAPAIKAITQEDGNICWQIGSHVEHGEIVPLEYLLYPIFCTQQGLKVRNRIIWTFGHGAHAQRRLSGRHESVLWLAKNANSYFNLDPIRVKQKYRGKKYYKGPKKGQWSANPLGKNPGDVWADIPNVKANHVEKTSHPCQFPVALAQRLIKALSQPGDLICDPFCGSGTTAIAALLEGRRFIGAELDTNYCSLIKNRINDFRSGKLKIRPLDKPLFEPSVNSTVASDPFITMSDRHAI